MYLLLKRRGHTIPQGPCGEHRWESGARGSGGGGGGVGAVRARAFIVLGGGGQLAEGLLVCVTSGL